MLEYPEIKTIAHQMATMLPGKTIASLEFPGYEKAFVFAQQTPSEFQDRLTNHTIETIESTGNHLFIFTHQGAVLNIGDTGGKLLYHESEKTIPKKFDLLVNFTDGSHLTLATQMWGFLSAVSTAEAHEHQHKILDEARDPLDETITPESFLRWLAEWEEAPKVNAKKFITARKYLTGIGNGYTQDILWHAKIHPRRKLNMLTDEEASNLLSAFQSVVRDAINHNGRESERDFFNQRGSYAVAMGRKTLGTPCPVCDTEIIKFAFEGGACYTCPVCQPDPRK